MGTSSIAVTPPAIWYVATGHACARLRARVWQHQGSDSSRLRRVLVALCFRGRHLDIDPWVIDQYYLGVREEHSGQDLILAMMPDRTHPRTHHVIRTVLWAKEFALWNRSAAA